MPNSFRAVGAAIAAAFFVAFFVPQPAAADDAMAQIKARGKMIVGVKADYPPFGFLKGDKNVGLEIDLLHRIAKDMLGNANAIEFVPVVSANRFQFLNTNKVDFLFSTVTITDKRREVIDFSEPYMKSGWQILVPSKNTTIKDAPDLKGKTVVVVPGSTGEAGITKMVPEAQLLKLAQTSEALQAVDQGRADAFIQDAALLAGLAQNYRQYKIVGKSYDDQPIGAACRKGDASPCQFISKEIAKFTKDGTMKKEYELWLLKGFQRFMP